MSLLSRHILVHEAAAYAQVVSAKSGGARTCGRSTACHAWSLTQDSVTTEIGCIPTCSAHAMLGQVARRTVLEWHKGSSDSETSRCLCRPHVKVTKAV